MKPIHYLMTTLLLSIFISQISLSQKLAIGIKAGLAFSNATVKGNQNPGGYAPSSNNSTGVLFGTYVDIKAGKDLIIRPGIELVPKGIITAYNRERISYLDIPLNFLYKINNSEGALLIGGGPTIGIPVTHTNSYTGLDLKTDLGINAMAGFELPIGASINLNYSYGLTNANKNNQDISEIRNRYFGITVGYTF